MAQMRGMSISVCNEYRFDNNNWSPLSRYMLMLRPKISKVVHPAENPNGVDQVDLVHMWRNHKWSHPGRAHIFFLADRWQDAEDMVSLGDVGAA